MQTHYIGIIWSCERIWQGYTIPFPISCAPFNSVKLHFFSTSDTEYALKPYTTYLVLKSIDPKKKFAAFHINKTFVTSYMLKPFKSDHIVGVTFSRYFATFRFILFSATLDYFKNEKKTNKNSLDLFLISFVKNIVK